MDGPSPSGPSTAGVVRAYLTHAQALPNPFKGYYVAIGVPARASAGRTDAEFRQFGVEVIGTVAPWGADVEVIALGDRYLGRVGSPTSRSTSTRSATRCAARPIASG